MFSLPARDVSASAAAIVSQSDRAQRLDDLALGRKPPGLLLGEKHLIVRTDDKDAAAAAHQFALDPERLLDLGRQTGSSRKVISNAAIVDTNVHGLSSGMFAVAAGSVEHAFRADANSDRSDQHRRDVVDTAIFICGFDQAAACFLQVAVALGDEAKYL